MRSSDAPHAFAFYAVAFALAVAVAALAGTFGEATPLVTMLTPAMAVIVMMLATGEARTRAGWAALGLFTSGLRGWWWAILGPVGLLVLCDAVLVLAGMATLQGPDLGASLPQIVVRTTLGLLIGIALAFCEEIGWRGYMLPRLAGIGTLRAMLLAGFLHGLWHLPLMLWTPYYHAGGNPLLVVPLFLVTLTLAGVFFGHLRLWTGSVWPVAIAHGAYNFVWGLGSEILVPASPETMEYVGGESGVLVIAGLALIMLALVCSGGIARRGA